MSAESEFCTPDIRLLFNYGTSQETESSWADALSDLHQAYILSFIKNDQAREAAVLSQFLAARERSGQH